MSRKPIVFALITTLAVAVAGCGDPSYGQAPASVRIDDLSASPGGGSTSFGGSLHSDVERIVSGSPTVFNDLGRVTFSLVLKDPGAPGITNSPSALNSVQFTRYRVVFRRTDGRNVQGVDVPYAFDSGMTTAVTGTGSATQTFDLVRSSAKLEAPLLALARNGQAIDTIADVTFYGRDFAGKNVAVTASIGVTFANFGDST